MSSEKHPPGLDRVSPHHFQSRWGETPSSPDCLSERPPDEIGRKNPAAGVHIHLGRPNFVLLTVTTEDRVPWLANPEAKRLLHETWSEATAWLVGDYLLMPDHLHLFCAPRDLPVTMEHWITYWKRAFRRRHSHDEWRFQSRGWHHRLRDDESYSVKWRYVQENPIRKGLAKGIPDWPYQGRVHLLPW
jgi:putative transposase